MDILLCYDVTMDMEDLIRFWKSYALRCGSRNFLNISSPLRDGACFHNLVRISGKKLIHENFIVLRQETPCYILEVIEVWIPDTDWVLLGGGMPLLLIYY